MFNHLKQLRFFGRNRREFFVSMGVVLLGSLLGFMFVPASPSLDRTARELFGIAWLFVAALTGFLCAVNARLDRELVWEERLVMTVWCCLLGLWMLHLLSWAFRLLVIEPMSVRVSF